MFVFSDMKVIFKWIITIYVGFQFPFKNYEACKWYFNKKNYRWKISACELILIRNRLFLTIHPVSCIIRKDSD